MYDDYDCPWEHFHSSSEADKLINQVILRGQSALDDYVWHYIRKGQDRNSLDAMIIAEEAAWKLCLHREEFSRGCPAIDGVTQDGWCAGCYVAGQLAFASGLLGLIWREQLDAESHS